ncbi:MAG: PDZ domain-containing protein [Phycisphaerales bacterium]
MPTPAAILRVLPPVVLALVTLPAPAHMQDEEGDDALLLIDEWLLDEPVPPPASVGPDATPTQKAKAARLEREALRAIDRGELERAEALLDEQRQLTPNSYVVYYNLACVRALMGLPAEATDMLAAAIEHGFDDIHQLRRDPQLDTIRDQPLYEDVVNHWDAILDARRDANVEHIRSWLDGRYEEATDAALRLTILSAHDETSTQESLRELNAIAGWARDNVFPDLLDPAQTSEDPWVVVVLPNAKDFTQWSVGVLGGSARGNFSQVGGAYLHDTKHLVAQNLGTTLRHEFFHVLHWRDMTRRGQVAPIWIQEGLCSLIEDYDLRAGKIVVAPSWRSNIVKRQLDIGRLVTITDLATYSQLEFSNQRPLSKYAQARTVFLYLASIGKLGEWYAAYTAGFDDDPTGVKAFETVFAKPIDQVESDYRDWVRTLPMVPETGSELSATLGVEIENGDGDGPVVTAVSLDARKRTGLRPLDRITAIDGAPTRDLQELIRRLGAYAPGAEVELSVRRGFSRHETLKASLAAR